MGQNIGNGDGFATLEAGHGAFDGRAIGPFRESVGQEMDKEAPVKFADACPPQSDACVVLGNGVPGAL